jgi:hypothetical protein
LNATKQTDELRLNFISTTLSKLDSDGTV